MGLIRIDRVGAEYVHDFLPLPARVRGAAVVAMALLVVACFFAGSATALPAGRAYEMVSLPDKQGKDLNFENYEVSADGDAVAYSAYPAFGNPEGGGFQNQYVATRQSPTWSFQALSVKQLPNPGQYSARIVGFSEDLRRFVFRTNAAVTPDAVDRVENLYLRDRITGETTLLSPGATKTDPFDFVEFVAASEDLSTIFYEHDEALRPGGGDGFNSIYEWADGELHLASVMPDGSPSPTAARVGNNDAFENEAVSDDGSRMYFTVDARIYLREAGQPTVAVSKTEAGAEASGTFLSATPDGRYAFFTSSEQLRSTDTNAQSDLYRFDAEDGSVDHLSVDAEPIDGVSPNVATGYIGAAADGSRIYFIATGQIVAGEPTTAQRKLYLWEEGIGPRFVSGLATGDVATNSPQSALSGLEKVSTDARYLTFASSLSLTGYPNANVRQLYRYDAVANEIQCVSCDPDGAPPVGVPTWRNPEAFFKYLKENVRAISDEGEVLFRTPQALVAEDINENIDVYLWNGEAAELVSNGRSGSPADAIAITPDGRDVFFLTRERLVGWDTDGAVDLYDARRGGGFPEPPDPLPPCDGSSCKPPPIAGPGYADPGSSDFRGSGNVKGNLPQRLRLLPVSAKQARRFSRSGRLPITIQVPRAGKVRAVAGAGGNKVASAVKRVGEPGRTRLVLRAPGRKRELIADAPRIQIEVRMGPSIATTTVKTGR